MNTLRRRHNQSSLDRERQQIHTKRKIKNARIQVTDSQRMYNDRKGMTREDVPHSSSKINADKSREEKDKMRNGTYTIYKRKKHPCSKETQDYPHLRILGRSQQHKLQR